MATRAARQPWNISIAPPASLAWKTDRDEAQLRTSCAWCGADAAQASQRPAHHAAPEPVSHGICKPCLSTQLAALSRARGPATLHAAAHTWHAGLTGLAVYGRRKTG